MERESKLDALERIVTQMLQPLKDVPFDLVVKALSGHRLIPFDIANKKDDELKYILESAIIDCCKNVKLNGIESKRANEVGNRMENPVRESLIKAGLRAETPSGKSGKAKAMGYPDILLFDHYQRPTYLEIKTFNGRNVNTTQRSFYLSPSEDFKVNYDARHLLLAFEMDEGEIVRIGKESTRIYRPVSYKMIALDDLSCDVKYEFNSDNRRMYARGKLILDGKV
jgi:hypothetical protein